LARRGSDRRIAGRNRHRVIPVSRRSEDDDHKANDNHRANAYRANE
jgi:hypothetical protein